MRKHATKKAAREIIEREKENKYYVFGGQYEFRCYGGAPTLIGAKRLASKCAEYWDNWQGWHTPVVYRAEDTALVVARGLITIADGCIVRVPRHSTKPCAIKIDGVWLTP